MSRLAMLKDRHQGERCVIVANGPSLNKMDLGFLKTETAIGLNKIYLGFKRFAFYPKYYVAINKKVIEQALEEIQNLTCVKFLGHHGNSGMIPEDALTHILHTSSSLPRFSKDLTAGIHEGWTVTHAALQIAYYMGFSQVVIIGMDHRFDYLGQPNETTQMLGNDTNHFSPDYFANGQNWDNPDLEQSEISYLAAKQVYQEGGREILDATLEGACTVFKKANYRKIFSL